MCILINIIGFGSCALLLSKFIQAISEDDNNLVIFPILVKLTRADVDPPGVLYATLRCCHSIFKFGLFFTFHYKSLNSFNSLKNVTDKISYKKTGEGAVINMVELYLLVISRVHIILLFFLFLRKFTMMFHISLV